MTQNSYPCVLQTSPRLMLWKVTHCSDQIHLTSKSNFRICLLLGCNGLESNTSIRFSMWKYGQSRGDPSCRHCGAALEDLTHFILSCSMLEPKCRELCNHPRPQLRDMNRQTYLTLAHEQDSFASIVLGINWIDEIKSKVFCIKFLADLKVFRPKLIQP